MARIKPHAMTLQEAKDWLRAYLRRLRTQIPKTNRLEMSQRITKNLLASPYYKKARVVAMFIGFGSEVETTHLIRETWKNGKQVLIPNTRMGFGQPYFSAYKPGDPLITTRYGPLEPKEEGGGKFDFKKVDLVLVPGLGFDGHGHRLGYGGGVYDQLLRRTPQAVHLGLFFSNQHLHRIPKADHDQVLDGVFTEVSFLPLRAR